MKRYELKYKAFDGSIRESYCLLSFRFKWLAKRELVLMNRIPVKHGLNISYVIYDHKTGKVLK